MLFHVFSCCLLLCAVKPDAALPEADARQIANGDFDRRHVRFRGVVASAFRDQVDSRFNWIILRSRKGKARASVSAVDCPLETLERLRDAEVDLTAYVRRHLSWRQYLGFQLAILNLKITAPPPQDPFSAAPLAGTDEPHRQKACGFVRAIAADRFFLRTDDGQSLPVKPASPGDIPRVGDRVTVVGFADTDISACRLEEALVRTETAGQPPDDPVRLVGVDSIIIRQDGQWHLNPDAYGAICRIRGTVLRAGDDVRFRLLDVGTHSFKIDLSSFDESVRGRLPVGSVAEITGLCHADFESDLSSLVFPRFQGFQLIPRTADDIRVLRQPPWWTPARLFVVIGVLLAVLALLGGWAVALRVVSARRARALAREQVANARAELKVEERTHLAVELHDSLSQTLTGVALQVETAADVLPGESAATGFLRTAQQMLASCRQELRCCLWDLRSRTFAERDLTEAVRRTIAPHTGHIATSVRFNVPRKDLSESTTHTILRIVRELTVNAIRHGHATQVRVAGEHHDDVITFSVTDNGCGFDPADCPGPSQGHFGLLGIRERLNELGGSFAVESAPGSGTRIVVTLKST